VFLLVSITRLPDRLLFRVFLHRIGSSTLARSGACPPDRLGSWSRCDHISL